MPTRFFLSLILIPLYIVSPLGVARAIGADEAFVGVLALAMEDEIATELGLSRSVRAQLEKIVDEREGEALEIALELRDLPEPDQAKQLTAFRDASEQLGLVLLSPKQRQTLDRIRLRRRGFESLSDPQLAQSLGLTSDQQQEVKAILLARESALEQVSASQASQTRVKFERQLKAILSPEQTQDWTQKTGSSLPGQPASMATERQLSKAPPKPQRSGASSSSTIQGETQLRFSFRYAPWQTVIEWFAEQCELSLLMDAPPQGTFNYSDPREYSRAQAIDLLNSVLLTKGYTLIRREKMLQVVNLEDGIPPNLIAEVNESQLDQLGDYELVRCLFTLQSVNAEDAREEIERLLGPQGTVNVLTSSNQLAITETAGRLRTFRQILQQGEQKNASALGKAKLVPLQHVRTTSIIAAWRKLMGLTEEDNATPDGSLRVTQGKNSRQLLVSGNSSDILEFEGLVRLLDVPSGLGPLDVPQLEVYPIADADPASVLSVMETLLEGADDLRLTTDPNSGSLVALARPEEHETIRATLKQLQADRRRVEVIRLRSIDPQLAMLSIEKLFGPLPGDEDAVPSKKQPIVDADPVTRSLLIRGSETQIEDIRTLLSKLGEDNSQTSGSGFGMGGDGSKLRMIPIDAGTARRAMERLNTIWPTVRKNRIRTVTPSAKIRGIRMGAPPASGTPTPNKSDSTTSVLQGSRFSSIIDSASTTDTRYVNDVSDDPDTSSPPESKADDSLPEVVVTIGEQGLIIASEDTDALDEFEELFRTLSDRLFAGSRQLTIFYLRYAKAEVAGEFVKQFVGGVSSGGGGGGGTLLGNLAGAALGGGSGGGIIGSLLGGGSGGSSASVSLSKGTSVIADPRLNALVVQATPRELDFIEELLQVLDRANSPEVIQTVPRPRAIPLLYADADEVAEIVRNVYASRMAGGSQAGRSKQPSPEDFIKAMTGQKDSGKQIAAAIGEQVGVTISVDPRRNALIVIAPQSLFEEIKSLVADLDFETPGKEETFRYGSVSGSSPEIIRSAIETLLEENDSSTVKNSQKTNKPNANKPAERSSSNRGIEDMKRRMEFFKAIQKATSRDKAAAAKKAKAGRSKGN